MDSRLFSKWVIRPHSMLQYPPPLVVIHHPLDGMKHSLVGFAIIHS